MHTNSLIFPVKEPDEVLDFQIDATTKIADSADTINAVSVAIAPSGIGEMTVSEIKVNGSFITIWLNGGIPARIYQVNVQVSTTGNRTYEWPTVVQISSDLVTYPIAPPDSAGFGPALIWSQ
jgi:predicted Zn-dependent protease